jgi:Recombination endonuclease VII
MTKKCRTCSQEKSLTSFGKHKDRKLGLADSCKACRNEKAILDRHGLTKSEKEAMLIAQSYRCAICDCHQSEIKHILSVDHCHKTGKIRGLLCPECNLGIGKFQDNVKFLKAAAQYLAKHKQVDFSQLLDYNKEEEK